VLWHVDDAHWLDHESQQCVTLGSPRLSGTPFVGWGIIATSKRFKSHCIVQDAEALTSR